MRTRTPTKCSTLWSTFALFTVAAALALVGCKESKNSPTEPPSVLNWLIQAKTEDGVSHAAVAGMLVYGRSVDYYESTRQTTNNDGWIPPQPMVSREEPYSIYWIAQPSGLGSANYQRTAVLLPTVKQLDTTSGQAKYVSIIAVSLATSTEPRAVAGCRLFDLLVGRPDGAPECGAGGVQ